VNAAGLHDHRNDRRDFWGEAVDDTGSRRDLRGKQLRAPMAMHVLVVVFVLLVEATWIGGAAYLALRLI
jgi:hypothetical protein